MQEITSTEHGTMISHWLCTRFISQDWRGGSIQNILTLRKYEISMCSIITILK